MRVGIEPRAPVCVSCARALPPEAAACPYCDEPAPPTLAGRIRAGCAVCAAAGAVAALALARPPLAAFIRLPETRAGGLFLALGAALLLDPFRWVGFPPPTRRGRLEAIARALGRRFGAALGALAALAAIRTDPSAVAPAVVALLLTAAACAASRDARSGFLAGLCVALA